MILETLLGGVGGAVLRLAPEVIKAVDRGNERKHELALLDKNTAAEAARAKAGLQEHQLAADSAQLVTAVDALKTALAGQFIQTGIKWVDALNQSLRPVLTYLIAGPYALGKFLVFIALLWQGGALQAELVQSSLAATYTGADMALVSGILNFYFLGRVFDKRGS